MNPFLQEPHGARCKSKLPANFVISPIACACLRSATTHQERERERERDATNPYIAHEKKKYLSKLTS
jgi:hypothetical protein